MDSELANDRTFLAWLRTAIAIRAAPLGLASILRLALAEIRTCAFALRLGWTLVAVAVEFRLAGSVVGSFAAFAAAPERRPAIRTLLRRGGTGLASGLGRAAGMALAVIRAAMAWPVKASRPPQQYGLGLFGRGGGLGLRG